MTRRTHTNKKKQGKHTPYKLIVAGSEYGCYEDWSTAWNIGNSTKKSFRIYDLNDNLIGEGL